MDTIALTYPGKIESYDSYMIGESNNTNLWRGFEKGTFDVSYRSDTCKFD
jgi:hypothetical protein